MEKVIAAFVVDGRAAPPEPVYPITAIPEGLGAPITPENLAAMCDIALALGETPSGWPWRLPGGEGGFGRDREVPAIPVMHRWKIGAPTQLWTAGGPCRSYPAAFLADYTFLEHDRGREERGAKSRAEEATGLRALWSHWFPSSRDPVLRPQDCAIKSPPPAYFKQPDGNKHHGEPPHRMTMAEESGKAFCQLPAIEDDSANG
jgi:hypothetical protein